MRLQDVFSSKPMTRLGIVLGQHAPRWMGYGLARTAANIIALRKPEVYWTVRANLRQILGPEADGAEQNLPYVERLVKTLLWARGGWKVSVAGPSEVGEHIREAYSSGGIRAFDEEFMGGVYEKPFTVEVMTVEEAPVEREQSVAVGRHLEGNRIGFDAGASDRPALGIDDHALECRGPVFPAGFLGGSEIASYSQREKDRESNEQPERGDVWLPHSEPPSSRRRVSHAQALASHVAY